jgi:hypothetical protein
MAHLASNWVEVVSVGFGPAYVTVPMVNVVMSFTIVRIYFHPDSAMFIEAGMRLEFIFELLQTKELHAHCVPTPF